MTIRISSDVGYLEVDFDPSKYKTKETAAKALYAALVKVAVAQGMPESEVIIRSPEQNKEFEHGPVWSVCWEAGPYQWALGQEIQGPWGYCEPYWSFDLTFVH